MSTPPTPTNRPTSPSGFKMPDGYQSLIVSKNHPTIALWIQTVKFASIDGGDKIVTTTMYNLEWHTAAARHLKKMDDATFKAAFDPDILAENQIVAAINDNTDTITEHWPDGSSRCYYGCFTKMGPPEMKEGEFPVADFTVIVRNTDSAYQEAGPVFTPAGGT